MKLLKSKAISILISLFIFAIFTFIYTILVYNGKIEAKTNDIYRFSIIIGAISFFLIGLISGIVEKKYGIISNFITGLILLIIIIVIKLLSKVIVIIKTSVFSLKDSYICPIIAINKDPGSYP